MATVLKIHKQISIVLEVDNGCSFDKSEPQRSDSQKSEQQHDTQSQDPKAKKT